MVDFTGRNHGMSETSEYTAWVNMKARCYNPSYIQSKDYMERGIKVCPLWTNFEAFYRDMGDKPSPQHSLDRIDNDKGYSPANCKWSTSREQALNKRPVSSLTGEKYITMNSSGKYHIRVYHEGSYSDHGTFTLLEEAVSVRDCILCSL